MPISTRPKFISENFRCKGATFFQDNVPENAEDGDSWLRESSGNFSVFWKTWHPFPEIAFGYILGGSTSSYIHRIAFPFDSGYAAEKGTLADPKNHLCGCNSSKRGYLYGNNSNIRRIDFPFDTGNVTLCSSQMSESKVFSSACGSSRHGFSFGGYPSYPNYTSKIERFTFPFDSESTSVVGNLSRSTQVNAGFNSSLNGFCAGGEISSTYFTLIDRITFPFDSGTASSVGNLSNTSSFRQASCNSEYFGFVFGGDKSLIERLSFPFDSGTASVQGNRNNNLAYYSGGMNSDEYGFHGAISGASYIERFSFPFDSGNAVAVGYYENKAFGVSTCRCIDGTDFNRLFYK